MQARAISDHQKLCYNEPMKKIIVKCPVPDVAVLEERALLAGMVFSDVIWQHERVYLSHDFRPKMNYPRIMMRTELVATDQPALYAMILKRHIEDSGIDLVNYTTVGDYTEATALVHQLGYRKVAEVSRQRREVWLDNRTVVYLDQVENVTLAFVKVELELTDDDSVAEKQAEIIEMLKLLGLVEYTVQSYAELLTGVDLSLGRL